MSPAANFARVDLDQLYLPFVTRLLEAIAACNARGFKYIATAGYRSFVEQSVIYIGNKVRAAPPGYSPHNYGLAVDFVRFQGDCPDWRPSDYAVLGEEVERVGLVWGGHFKHGTPDCPHVNWPGYSSREQLEPLKAVYEAHAEAPLSAVFEFLATAPRAGAVRPAGGGG